MNLHQQRLQARDRFRTAAQSRRARPGAEFLEDRCVPAVFSVNSLADILNPGPGVVTLRSAIQQANATSGGNTIDLTVPGTYKITLAGTQGETDNAAGEFAILPGGGNLNIVNTSGGQVVVDGNDIARVFDINPNFDPANPTPGFAVTLTGLTIEDGIAGDPANLDGPTSSGGGIRDNGNASLTLNDVTVTNNSATADGGGVSFENTVSAPWTLTVNDSVISDNHAGDAGGGLEEDGSGKMFINAGTVITGNSCVNQGAGIWLDAIQVGNAFQTANLTVTGAVVSDNAAQAGPGGGIGNAGNGVVTIAASTISDNSTGGTGGGFGDQNNQGTLVVQDSLFQGNAAVGSGGAIAVGSPSTTITGSELKGNSSGGAGGGIFANGTTLTVGDSTIADNVATGNGGGVEIETSGTGAAGSAITFTTIAANAALNNNGGVIGGGVDVGNAGTFSGALQLTNDTINANFAVSGGGVAMASGGTVDVQNTIIAGNQATNAGVDYLNVNGTHYTSQGGNLVGNNNGDGTFTQGTDQSGTGASPLNPLLGPLQDNGGPTVGAAGASLALETEALLTGSPAIGKGVAPGAAGADERGFTFAGNAPFDVGAFQSGAVAAASMVNLVASVPSPVAGQSLTFTATVAPQQAGSTTGTPIGTVVFTVDGSTSGSFALNEAGVATLVLPAGLSAGPHSVTAAYEGGGRYAASSTTLAVPVGPAGSTTHVVASANSVALGQPVTLTAIVAAAAPGVSAATGTISFFDGGTLLGTAPLLAGGQAVFTTTTLGVGPHMLTATFAGNGNLTGSTATAAAAVTVTKATPTVSLVAFGQQLRPGQATTLVVDVTGPAGPASGTVTFLDNGAPAHGAVLNGGVAIFTTAKLHRGVNVFTVAYGGDGNDQPATSTAVDVVVVTRKKGHGGHNSSRPAQLAVSHGHGGSGGPRREPMLDRVLHWGRRRS